MNTTLLSRTLASEAQRHAAAVAAIETRAGDFATVDRLLIALGSRGWKVDAYAEVIASPHVPGECRLHLAASVTQTELTDLLEYLSADGVFCAKVSRETGRALHYSLRLAHFGLTLDAYVHPAAKAAA